jgi:hypothetical protein
MSSVKRRAVGLLVLIVLAVLALLPQTLKVHTRTVGMPHDLVHIGAFFLCFMLIAFPSKGFKEAAAISLALLVFGFLLEQMQTQMYGTRLEYSDIVLDGIGIVLGILCWVGRGIAVYYAQI